MPASIFNGDAVKILKDKLRFKTTGEIAWDAVNGCPSYPSDIANVTNQIGQETHARVYNATGTILTDGTAVYVQGVDVDGTHPAVMRAIANDYSKSRILGLVTADIAIGAHGIVTIDGIVNGQNTVAYSPGTVLKLSATVAGTYSATALNDGNYDTTVGIVVKQDATTGSILVYSAASDYTVETTQKTGWSNVYGPATIAFVDANRTLTLNPVGTEFHYYQAGVKYSKTTDSFQIADTEGLHYLYYNAGVITDIINPTAAQVSNVLQNYTTIAYIGWDATNKLNVFVGKELHDMQFPSLVHNYNHFAYGARYISGLGPNSIIAEGNGSLDSHAQFGLDAGAIADEDIFLPTSAVTSTTGLPIFYLAGTTATPTLRKTTQAGFAVKTTGTGRLGYNFLTGGNWTIAEVSNGNYVLCHVFCIHENDITKRPIAFMGQAQYSTVALARAGAQTEISNLVTTGIIPQEIKSIATFVFETRDSYLNSVNGRIREISTGVNYIDWRAINNTGGSATSGGSSTSIFSDNSFQIYDDLDPTKTFQAQLSSLTTGTNRVGTAPDRNFNMGNISSWVTATHYLVTDTIRFTDERLYRCAIDHTSGTFATDLNSGNWVALSIDSSDGYNYLAGKIPTSFFAFDDGTAYVDGTGGSPSFISVAASPAPITNEPGRLNLRISKSATGSALGEGVSVDFTTRGLEDLSAVRTIRFKATTSANYIDNAFRFYFYDKTNNVIVNVSGDPDLKASSFVNTSTFEVQFPANSTDLRCSVYCNDSTVTAAYDIDCTWEILEKNQNSGPVISDWVSYTPTLSDSTNVGTNLAKYRRVGGDAEIMGYVAWTGAGSGTTFAVSVPAGLAINGTNLVGSSSDNCSGISIFYDVGTAYTNMIVTAIPANGNVRFVFSSSNANFDGSQASNGDALAYRFTVPILGWSSNTVMSEDAGNRKITGTAFRSADQTGFNPSNSYVQILFDSTTAFAKNPIDNSASFNVAGGYWEILETGTHFIDLGVRVASTNVLNNDYMPAILVGTTTFNASTVVRSKLVGRPPAGVGFDGQVSGYLDLIKGDRVFAGIYGAGNNSSSTLTIKGTTGNNNVTFFSIVKFPSSQQIASSAVQKLRVIATSGTITGGASADILGTFTTKQIDNYNQWVGSTCTLTCSISGVLSGGVRITSSANITYSANDEIDLYAAKNGTTFARATVRKTAVTEGSGATHDLSFNNFPVVKGDLIQFYFYCDKTYTLGAGVANNVIDLTVEA